MFWLAVFIVVLFGGYSAAWFYAADRLEKEVRTALAIAEAGGQSVECANPTARGFPFRFGLYCDAVGFDDGGSVRAGAGALRTAAQVYNPFHVVGELDGPATLEIRGAPPLKLDWQTLQASARLASPLPQRVSLAGTGLTAETVTPPARLQAATFDAHMRPNGRDLDIAGSAGGLTLDPALVGGRAVPPLAGEVDATVAEGVSLLLRGVEDLKGRSVTIRRLSVSTGPDTGISLNGNLSTDEQGLLDGELTLTLRDPKGLAALAGTLFPEAKDQIGNAMLGFAALGDSASMPLRIVKGKATLGFVPLGDIPPL